MKDYIIEKGSGIPLGPHTLLLKDEFDMSNVEFWEERLEKLNQPYVVAYREIAGKICYSIFTDLKSKNSVFK